MLARTLACCCATPAWLFAWKIHLNIWMYRRHETYVWEDQNEGSVRKLPNYVLFPLRSCSFEGFDVPCPRLAEGWWHARVHCTVLDVCLMRACARANLSHRVAMF